MTVWRRTARAGSAGRLGTAMLAILFFVGAAGADELKPPQTPFQAYMTFHSDNGLVMEGPLWYDRERERRQISVKGRETTLIARSDKNAIYMIEPQAKMVMQMKMQQGMRYYDKAMMAQLNPKRVGSERVSGESTVKYSVNSAAASTDGFEGFMWVTSDGIVMKQEGKTYVRGKTTSITMLLKDLKRGPVDPNLFEIPAGYRVMNLN